MSKTKSTTVSYAIPVCNEIEEVKRLTQFLIKIKNEQDEIVILVDQSNHTQEVKDYVEQFAQECHDQNVTRAYFPLNKDFAAFKNHLNSLCSGDYIFQIDADEIPCTPILETLPLLLEQNPEVEVYLVPRVNTVKGLTDEHIKQWRWNVNSEGWVNWPDYQWRIYKNTPSIKWKNKVHEQLTGFVQYANLPMEEDYSLYHPKTIDRQIKQNEYYNTL